MRALIYTRVSSNQQEETGASLETQLDRCRAHAAEHDWQIAGELSDTHTGMQYREREGLSRLRELVRAAGIDVVLCYAIDRLSRNQAHLYILAEEFEEHDAQLAFVTESFEDSAVGRFIRSAKAFAAEVEHEKIKERTTRGKLARLQSGKLLPNGKPRYGYRWRDEQRGQLDIDEPEAAIVRRIYTWCAEGCSLRAIARRLAEQDVPSPTGRPRWAGETVRNLLRCEAYAGVAYGWGYSRSVPGKNGQQFDAERAIQLPDGTIPPIVKRHDWEAVQAILDRNQQRAVRSAREPEAALLRGGFAKCGYCGRSLMARPTGRNSYEYVCGQVRTAGYSGPKPAIRAHQLDIVAWAIVRAVLTEPGIIERELERLRTADPTAGELAQVHRALVDIERQRDNLARAIAMADDAATTAIILDQLRTLGERRTSLLDDEAALLARRDGWRAAQRQLADLDAWRAAVAVNVDDLSYHQKRLLMDVLGLQIRLWKTDHEPRYEITLNIQTAPLVTSTT